MFKEKFDSLEVKYQYSHQESGSRMPALDLARCIAMLMMIQGHTVFELTAPGNIDVNIFPWYVWEFLRGVTAPIFLIVSGVVQVFANKRDSSGSLKKDIIRRRITMALGLLALGYLLVFPADKIYHLLFIDFSVWQSSVQVNVLQLIGVSLLLVVLTFSLTKNDNDLRILSIIIAVTITIMTPIIHIINWFNILPEFFAAFLSNSHGSIFTIFPFTGLMFYGIAFGLTVKRQPADKRNSFIIKNGLFLGLILLFIGTPIYYFIISMNLKFDDVLKGNPGMLLIRSGVVFIILSVITFIYTKTSKLSTIYSIFGKRALFIYIIHLIILYGTPWQKSFAQVNHNSLPLISSVIIALLVQISSLTLAYLYDLSLKKYPMAATFYKYAFGSLIIYLLLV